MSGETTLIVTTRSGVRPLGVRGEPLHNAAPQLRRVVRRRLGDAAADLLADPQLHESDQGIDWYAGWSGPVRAVTDLEPAERDAVLARVEATLAEMRRLGDVLAGHGPKEETGVVGLSLKLAARAPSPAFVFLVGDRPVIVAWGYEKEPANALLPLALPRVPDARVPEARGSSSSWPSSSRARTPLRSGSRRRSRPWPISRPSSPPAFPGGARSPSRCRSCCSCWAARGYCAACCRCLLTVAIATLEGPPAPPAPEALPNAVPALKAAFAGRAIAPTRAEGRAGAGGSRTEETHRRLQAARTAQAAASRRRAAGTDARARTAQGHSPETCARNRRRSPQSRRQSAAPADFTHQRLLVHAGLLAHRSVPPRDAADAARHLVVLFRCQWRRAASNGAAAGPPAVRAPRRGSRARCCACATPIRPCNDGSRWFSDQLVCQRGADNVAVCSGQSRNAYGAPVRWSVNLHKLN